MSDLCQPCHRHVQQARALSEDPILEFYWGNTAHIDYGEGDIKYTSLSQLSNHPIPLISESFTIEEQLKKEEQARMEAQHPKLTQIFLAFIPILVILT